MLDLCGAVLRANPDYAVVLLDRLTPEQRDRVRAAWSGGDLYGVLLPRERSHAPIKAIDHDTALLFLTLQTPGPAPSYLAARCGDATAATISELVVDGVLEVHHDGRFVTGASALDLLGEARPSTAADALARLSLQALRYADALGADDPALLAARLYRFHCMPLGPEQALRLPDSHAVSTWLGTGAGAPLHAFLAGRWSRSAPEVDPDDTWSSWSRASGWTPRGDARNYKLYVSPRSDDLPDTLAIVARVLTESRAIAWKHAATPVACLRPDKLVAYFTSIEDLVAAGERLRRELAGCAAHGVPFTAELGLGGLLSWAVDPPRSDERTSWRGWLTSQLATFLVSAGAAGQPGIDRCAYALDRVQSLGVDTDRWLPRSPLFTDLDA